MSCSVRRLGARFALTLAAGCGSSTTTPSADGRVTGDATHARMDAGLNVAEKEAAERFYGGLVDAICENILRCCNADELTYIYKKNISDLATCKARIGLTYVTSRASQGRLAAVGRLKVQQDKADACLSGLKAATCVTPSTSSSSTPLPPLPRACETRQAFKGLVALGEPCTANHECALDARCSSSLGAGVCVPLFKDGEPCGFSSECLDELTCTNGKAGPMVCRPPAKEGQSCADVGCDPDDPSIFCESQLTSTDSPACVKRRAVGGNCKGSPHCEPGLFCDLTDPKAGRCVEKGKLGGPCLTRDSAQCETGLFCDSRTDPTKPVCAAKKKENDPCYSYTECLSSSCQAPTAGGANVCTGKPVPLAPVCDGK